MVSRYMLNKEMWVTVETIYSQFKDQPFTVHDIAETIAFPGRVTGHLLGAMPSRGIIERCSDRTKLPAYWRFTSKFKVWYETKYLSEMMGSGLAIPVE